jgi:hypothetical protein
MIRVRVREALQVGIDAADEDAARASFKHGDPVLRPLLRRRFERAMVDATVAAVDAANASGAADVNWAASGQPDAVAHCMKLASLRLTGARPAAAHEREHVATAYAALPRLTIKRGLPWVTGLMAVLALAVVGIGGWYAQQPSSGGPRSRLPPPAMSTPVAGAFVNGGVPLVDEKLALVLRERLPKLVIATDRVAAARHDEQALVARAALAAELRAEPWFATHGDAIKTAWVDVLSALDAWATVPDPDQAKTRELIDDVIRYARALSDQFAALGLGYYVEGDGFGGGNATHAVLYSYRVEQVVFVDVATRGRRVLSLRRIDKLNLQRALLGMESATLGDPMVLLDQIDEHVVTQVLPTLVPDAYYDLGDEDWQTAADQDGAVRGPAGHAVRAEMLAALGPDAAAAQQVARLIVERRAILETIAAALRPRGISMNFPDEIFVGEGYLDSLDGSISHSQGDRLTEIEAELQRINALTVAQRLQQVLVATVRRHEAQHGVDGSEGLHYPELVLQNVGPEEIGDRENSHGTSVNAELSAYVSQIANDPATPKMAFWSLARHAFSAVNWGRSESYVAVFIIEGLAEQLHIPSRGPVIHDGEIDRQRLSKLALAVSATDVAPLRQAAAALWTHLYQTPFAPIVDRKQP